MPKQKLARVLNPVLLSHCLFGSIQCRGLLSCALTKDLPTMLGRLFSSMGALVGYSL